MDVDGSLKRIEAVLRHFTLEQLADIVIPDFQILSWHNVRQKIIQEQHPLNKNSIIRFLVFAVKKHITRKATYATEILQIIRLRDIAVHHYRYRWIAFKMSGETRQGTKRYYTCSEIQDSIETIFCRKKRLVEVAMISEEEIYFISLIEKKRMEKRLVFSAPIFVAHFPGQPYFFVSQSGKKEDVLHVISRVLGYTGAKDCSLSGQNVRHLLRFLKNRESDAASAQDVLQGVGKQKHATFEETEKGMDFTQRRARKEFADGCFGRELTLQQVTLKCSQCQWMIGDIVPDTEGKNFGSMEVSFQSPDILKMWKEMTVKGIFSMPPPPYVCSLRTRGKNNIKLEYRENDEVSVRM